MFAKRLISIFIIITLEWSTKAMWKWPSWSSAGSYKLLSQTEPSGPRKLQSSSEGPDTALPLIPGRWYTLQFDKVQPENNLYIENLCESHIILRICRFSKTVSETESREISDRLITEESLFNQLKDLKFAGEGVNYAIFFPDHSNIDLNYVLTRHGEFKIRAPLVKCHEDILAQTGICVDTKECTLTLIPDNDIWYDKKGFRFL